MTVQDRLDELLDEQRLAEEEGALLVSPIVSYQPQATPTLGVNDIYHVGLASGGEAFHKPSAGVVAMHAQAYGHHPDAVPFNDCAAWRLARGLGGIIATTVAPCVLRAHAGEYGSLCARREGIARTRVPFSRAPEQCRVAGFFDSLIAQQDRHLGNFRWDAARGRLGLIDHG